MTNIKLTFDQLLKLYKDGETFTAWVDYNPFGEGERTKLPFVRTHNRISSAFDKSANIDGVDYAWVGSWERNYDGLFEIVEEEPTNPQHQKPEIYQVGSTVEILESARDCGTYSNWDSAKQGIIGTEQVIEKVYDDSSGVAYSMESLVDYATLVPHYCVKLISKPQTKLTKQEIADRLCLDINELEII